MQPILRVTVCGRSPLIELTCRWQSPVVSGHKEPEPETLVSLAVDSRTENQLPEEDMKNQVEDLLVHYSVFRPDSPSQRDKTSRHILNLLFRERNSTPQTLTTKHKRWPTRTEEPPTENPISESPKCKFVTIINGFPVVVLYRLPPSIVLHDALQGPQCFLSPSTSLEREWIEYSP